MISEGIAMVALKRLADAERDGDRIYAVIKGVGGSSDGNAKGLTAPLPGRADCARCAGPTSRPGFGAGTPSALFEAHGTGTVAGDTAELESTTRLIKEAGGSARAGGDRLGQDHDRPHQGHGRHRRTDQGRAARCTIACCHRIAV